MEFRNLTDGTTSISGGNIKTGTISADRLESKVLTTDNISTKNLTVTGKLLTTGSYGGVRIEDQVIIREGGVENLIRVTHDLIEL